MVHCSCEFGYYNSINNCPMRCNTKQYIYYSASLLYMFWVSNTPIIRSTQNCNYSLRHCSYFLCSYLLPWPTSLESVFKVLCTPDDGCVWHPKLIEGTYRIINRLLCVASRWTVINPLNAQLHTICHLLALLACHLLALLAAHHILRISRIRVNIDQRCTEP